MSSSSHKAARRTFIKGLAAVPAVLSFSDLLAAEANTAHQALVIGNSAYDGMALPNPANDAQAMSGLLGRAGFTIDSHINAPRADMMKAMDRFADTILRSDTKLAILYYAGHGVQLDWRNYLVPVDATVDKRSDIQTKCVDLNNLLAQISTIKDKTFIIILDACRDDPFGKKYRPENKGLSQFDAPVGSLLAYSTSPGKVASDGSGKNGLYTENLVRELSAPNVRLEDALKRVRLGVRLASGGEQIPWETTSLESDVFLFGGAASKMSAADIDRAVEEEIADWTRVKGSTSVDDWVAYLRKYPNGRFAELAQNRLNRLLPPKEVVAPVSIAKPTAQVAAQTGKANPAMPASPSETVTPTAVAGSASAGASTNALRLGPGIPVPQIWVPSKNPYSAGRYPVGRKFSVGDTVKRRISDLHTNVETAIRTATITRVDVAADLVELNNGQIQLDTMGNLLARGNAKFKMPLAMTPAEYQLGKRWKASNERTRNGKTDIVVYDVQIVAVERIKVPAGEFDTFRIEADGWNLEAQGKLKDTFWQVPGLNFAIRMDRLIWGPRGEYRLAERQELVELFQQETMAI